MIILKSLLSEKFETVSDLLLNPEYDNTYFRDLLKEFQSKGGKVMGQGRSGIVLFHPGWKFVLKLFSDDCPYLKFIRFVLKNPRPSYPKIFDKPRRIIPHFKRITAAQYLYVVPIEKLDPIGIRDYDTIQYYLYYANSDAEELAKSFDNLEVAHERLTKMEHDYPHLKNFYDDYRFLLKRDFGSLDINSQNIMKRSNGEFVITDPFWEGETPYRTHDQMVKPEADYYGQHDYDDPDPEVTGGKLYKKPKPKKVSVSQKPSPEDDSPF